MHYFTPHSPHCPLSSFAERVASGLAPEQQATHLAGHAQKLLITKTFLFRGQAELFFQPELKFTERIEFLSSGLPSLSTSFTMWNLLFCLFVLLRENSKM